MKRIVALILGMALCFFISPSYAASIGNPIKPLGHMKFAVAAETNFIFDRSMASGGINTTGSTVSTINAFDISKITQGYVKGVLGITDYVNIFVKVGASKINGIGIQLSTGEKIDLESDNNFLYGAGANLAYQIHSDDIYFVDVESDFVFFWGLSGELSYFKADADEMYIDGTNQNNVSGEIKNQEYQVGLFAGIEIPIDENASVVPYAGGFWNSYNIETGRVDYGNIGNVLSFDTDDVEEFGPVAGVEVELSENVSLNVEGRFFGGHAISAGGTVKF